VYALIVERIVRRAFAALSRGDWRRVTENFADDAHFRFPGRHRFAGDYHSKPEIVEWFRNTFETLDIELEVHDVTVRGMPWKTRVCTRFTAHVTAPDGTVFHNDGMQYLNIRWGRVVRDFLYEDTQMVAEYEEHLTDQQPAAAS
jgi:ketosteroid isomerase-like protein